MAVVVLLAARGHSSWLMWLYRSIVPLNNQSPAVTERSSAAGEATTPGPPRGITLNRQNSIGAGGGAGPPDRCRLRQSVAPIPAPTPSAISSSSPATGARGDHKTKTERVRSNHCRRPPFVIFS